MNLTNDSFFYFVLLVVPGFIAFRVFSAFVATRASSDDKHFLVSAAALGACMLAVTLPLWLWLYGEMGPTSRGVALATLLSIFAWPLLAGGSAGLLIRSKWFLKVLQHWRVRAPHASAWDHFFSRAEACFVRVTMDDGAMVGGYWLRDGFASSGAGTRDLYLDEQWLLDPSGAFVEPMPLSKGCWIDVSRARCVEFLRIEEEHGKAATDDAERKEGRIQAEAEQSTSERPPTGSDGCHSSGADEPAVVGPEAHDQVMVARGCIGRCFTGATPNDSAVGQGWSLS